MESVNWREEQQARNLCKALDALSLGTKLLVWCGKSHHAKDRFDWLAPMGHWFPRLSGISHFAIDQRVTVDFASGDGRHSGPGMAEQFKSELVARGGTAGFLTEDAPVSFLRDRTDQDSFILSTENELA